MSYGQRALRVLIGFAIVAPFCGALVATAGTRVWKCVNCYRKVESEYRPKDGEYGMCPQNEKYKTHTWALFKDAD
jgi:hypothetical protein